MIFLEIVGGLVLLVLGAELLVRGAVGVARRLDVSTRTLEYSFQEVLDTTPAAYIKIVRLHEARRAIRRAAPQETVTNIAATWGFWHFGRFASDYRKLFGELPSETRGLRRAFNS